MWKSIGFVALWVLASCAAIAVAWAGVSTVSNEIVAPAPVTTNSTMTEPPVEGSATPPQGDTIDEEPPLTAEPDVAPTTSAGTVDPTGQQSPTTVAGQSPGEGSVQSAPPTTTAPSAAVSTTAPSPTTSAPGPTSTAPTTTTTTTTPATSTTTPAGTTETFVLVGGTASVRYESGDVTVLWATPNAGFEVKVEPESPGLKVEFRSDNHRSRVDVWWANGPMSEIREEPDN